MRIKSRMRNHFTPVGMAITKRSMNNMCLRGCGEKGALPQCWWESKLIEPLWRTEWRFLKKQKQTNKLGIKLPYDPAILALGYTLRKP